MLRGIGSRFLAFAKAIKSFGNNNNTNNNNNNTNNNNGV